jgi:membrane protease YdiL (CAAX protease family)|tara:strand:- start:532 stop:1443 length:912 start_codon:yes stop_codon:yes gene_type:complete
MNLKGIYAEKSISVKFALFCILTFFSVFIFSLLSYALIPIFFKFNFSELNILLSDYNNATSVKALKFLQLFSSVGLFVIPPLLFAHLTTFSLRFKQSISRQRTLLTVAIMLLIHPFIAYLLQWNQNLVLPEFLEGLQIWIEASELKAKQITEAFLEMSSMGDLLVNLILIALIPAIGEELLFRGVFQQLFAKWTGKVHLAIFISAFLFSAIHIQFFGFLPRFVLGIILGYMFYWSKNLWLPILAHFTNNAMAIIFIYPFVADKMQIDFLNDEIPVDIGGALISFLAVALLMYLLYKKSSIKKI